MNAELLWYTIGFSLAFNIGIFVTSIFFQQDTHALIKEYKNVSRIWREVRVTCGKCRPATVLTGFEGYTFGSIETVGCEHGPDRCYKENAENQAAHLDFHELLAVSSWDGFGKYRDNYNFNLAGSGETYIEERELKLRGYLKSWATLVVVALCFALFQIVGLITLGVINTFRKKWRMEKLWIGAFLGYFFFLLAMFTTAILTKTNYECPGLQEGSKYGGTSTIDCEKGVKTWGRPFCAFLGANMSLDFILSTYLIHSLLKDRKYENLRNGMIKY